MENMDMEFAQVSVVRLMDFIGQKSQLEKRIMELEFHINRLESLLQSACDSSNYDWVTIDKDEIKKIMYVKEDENE